MLFNSIEFLAFFPLVIALYFALPHKYRWILLLSASYFFYMCWKVEYVILIMISTLVDYLAALRIQKTNSRAIKKLFLTISLATNIGLLFGFKYFNFVSETINNFFSNLNVFQEIPLFELLLPVGISFYTFQTLSYTIDVYRGKKEVERHLGYFALYVSFFPQLVAGPIERASSLLPQLRKKLEFDYDRAVSGLQLMVWGFFKKIVIADSAAAFVNIVYNNPNGQEGLSIIFATLLFAIQIYCDFSGYSDIAIGVARIMGYDLMKNFRTPYYSKSVSEFWKRWHISLSSWFKDYLYIPLGGNRVVKWRFQFNIIITFLISGLWHGANWTFLIWGGLHGFYLIMSYLTKNYRAKAVIYCKLDNYKNIYNALRTVFIFSIVCFAWIFFRADSVATAFKFINSLYNIDLNVFIDNFLAVEFVTIKAVFFIIIMEAIHLFQRRCNISEWIKRTNFLLRWALYFTAIMILVLFGTIADPTEFIYFQF